MKECKECELAIYCFTESSTWIFRTKQEMEEKRAVIEDCPLRGKKTEGKKTEDRRQETE